MVLFETLSADEQEEAFARLGAKRTARRASEESYTERFLRSLCRAAEVAAGTNFAPADYKSARAELAEQSEAIEPFSRLIRRWGTWLKAKEALALSETSTAWAIEARFRHRRTATAPLLGRRARRDDAPLNGLLRRAAGPAVRARRPRLQLVVPTQA